MGNFLDLLLFNNKFNALKSVWSTRVDFPLPETPVTHVKVPIGILRSTFCKLFALAPNIYKNLPFLALFLLFGISINFFPDR